MLVRIPEVLSADALVRARAIVDAADWAAPEADGVHTAGTQSAVAKNNRQLPEDGDDARALRAIVLDGLARSALFQTAALPRRIYPPLFNRYGGEHNAFGDHVDNALRTHARSNTTIRTDLSATLFLADPHEYDGGELVISHAYGEQSVKLAAGDMVLYPSGSVHRVTPVTRGARLACFFWLESLVREEDRRRTLFDLDMAILALRQRQGDDGPDAAQIVSLTGIYHNLLRMWAIA